MSTIKQASEPQGQVLPRRLADPIYVLFYSLTELEIKSKLAEYARCQQTNLDKF